MNKESQKKILIVDDDELLRKFYAKVLISEEYLVSCVGDGDEAIVALEETKDFDLAIVDLLMPVRTGWELIEYMKNSEQLKEIPILVLTGLAPSFDDLNDLKKSCAAVMHKGRFELPEFIETIKGILK